MGTAKTTEAIFMRNTYMPKEVKTTITIYLWLLTIKAQVYFNPGQNIGLFVFIGVCDFF